MKTRSGAEAEVQPPKAARRISEFLVAAAITSVTPAVGRCAVNNQHQDEEPKNRSHRGAGHAHNTVSVRRVPKSPFQQPDTPGNPQRGDCKWHTDGRQQAEQSIGETA